MYTQHQEGIDDIFVCDICEAIFLREPSIVEHLQAQHKEELLALDAGQLRYEQSAYHTRIGTIITITITEMLKHLFTMLF